MSRRRSVAFVDGSALSARKWLLGCLAGAACGLAAGCANEGALDGTGEANPGVSAAPASGGAGGAGASGSAGAPVVSGGSGHASVAPGDGDASGPSCAAGRLSYKGTVDDGVVSFAAPNQGGLTSTASSWWLARYAPPSQLYAFGPGAITEQPLLAATDVFLQSGWDGSQGAWYCAPSAAFSGSKSGKIPLNHSFSLPDIRRLGVCPGTPVEGSITACVDANAKGDPACPGATSGLSGSIDGVALDATPSGAIANHHDTPGALFLFDDQRSVLGVATFEGKTSGFVLRHDPSTDRRTLYCLGDGTTYSQADGQTRVQVPTLSRLGACSTGSPSVGTLTGCM